MSFDRVDGQIDLTFQDSLSGLDQAEVIDAANYQLTKLHTIRGTYVVNVISATPNGPTGPENVVLTINDGRQLRGGIYYFTVFSGAGATGIRDVAGNALDGEFYGFFPSGNNIPGGNFVAGPQRGAPHHLRTEDDHRARHPGVASGHAGDRDHDPDGQPEPSFRKPELPRQSEPAEGRQGARQTPRAGCASGQEAGGERERPRPGAGAARGRPRAVLIGET